MPIIDCPDCGKPVSDLAPACPSCARPMRAMTIEATGKYWKAIQLWSGGAAMLGFIVMFSWPLGGGLLLTLGLICWLTARLGGWWEHG